MGFLCEAPEPTPVNTTQTVVNQLPAYEQEARQRLYTKASDVANTPYQPYGGTRLADFTPDQLDAFGLTRGNVGAYAPGMYNAYTALGKSAQTFPEANLSAYMNPYSQAVTDIAAREAKRTWDVNRQQINDAATRAGAFGGSRHGIAEAEGQRNLNTQLSDIYLKGGESAFRNAAQLFNADQDRLLKAGTTYGALAGQDQAYGLKDAAALQAIGEAQQGQGQKNLDLAYQNFVQQRDYPREQVNWLSNIIKGTSLPSGSTTTGQQLVPQTSPLAQVAGLATTGLGLYGLINGLKKGGRVKSYRTGGRVRGYADGGSIPGEEQFSNLNPAGLRALLADPAYSQAEKEVVKQMLMRNAPPPISTQLSRIANTPTPQVTTPGPLPPPSRQFADVPTDTLHRINRKAAFEGDKDTENLTATELAARKSQYNSELMNTFSRMMEKDPTAQEQLQTATPSPKSEIPAAPGMRAGEGEMPSNSLVAPGSSPAAGQTSPGMPSTSGGGGVRNTPQSSDSMTTPRSDIEKKIFAPYSESPDVTKPYDTAKVPEADKLDEKVSPWMAITRAGLGMMAAKPGQSALAAIGEGGIQGLDQYGKDIERASKNKQTNFENTLRSATMRLEMAKAETDRSLKEKQLKLADRDSQRAERILYLDWVKTGDLRDFHNKSLAIQGAALSKNPYQMQYETNLKWAGAVLGLDEDPAKWSKDQRQKAAEKAMEFNGSMARMINAQTGQDRLQFNALQTQYRALNDQLTKGLASGTEANNIRAKMRMLEIQMNNMGMTAEGIPLNPAIQNLFPAK